MTIIDMVAPAAPIPAIDEEEAQNRAAYARVLDRAHQRNRTEELLEHKGGVAKANTPDRLAARYGRLTDYYVNGEPADGACEVRGDDPGRVVEAIINTCDYVSVRYLDAGVAAVRAIGRVNISRGRGYGTGFLVSPGLLLTNHHVLTSAEVAANSAVEFNYQNGLDGQPLPVETFALSPDRFYVSDRDLDFALTAVDATAEQLQPFGFHKLTAAQGTVVLGEFTTIVHHPRGERKMISLRENKLLDILERYLHYTADTEPGSSGSPVFNDQWEVVALHHASTRVDRAETGGIINEGTRISRIIAHLQGLELSDDHRKLLEPVIGTAQRTVTGERSTDRGVAAESLGPQPKARIVQPVVPIGDTPVDTPIDTTVDNPAGFTVMVTVYPNGATPASYVTSHALQTRIPS